MADLTFTRLADGSLLGVEHPIRLVPTGAEARGGAEVWMVEVPVYRVAAASDDARGADATQPDTWEA